MSSSLRRIFAGVGGAVLAIAASVGHAAYITGQQYTFSGTAITYTVSGAFTVGAETGPGTGIFNFASFTADSGAPGTDILSGIDASDTVSSSGIFTVSFSLADGYNPAFSFDSVNRPDTVSLSGADTILYTAAGASSSTFCTVPIGGGTPTDCTTLFQEISLPRQGTFSVQLTDTGNRVPEPDVLALLGLAASAGALLGRRRR